MNEIAAINQAPHPREGGGLVPHSALGLTETPAFAGEQEAQVSAMDVAIWPGLVNSDGSRWHYLDTAATAQKPQVVIDAMARAIDRKSTRLNSSHVD